MEYLLTE